ncbi:MAG: prepilin-type N-terminal cleavage/methylation domain-containing protein [Candidatus Paceibacterota bacterium]
MFKKFNKNKYNSGITLVELLVVISIMMVLSGITMFDYNKYRSQTLTQNLADDIALSVRKAQSYAIGVHKSDSVFDVGYGVHFSTTIPVNGDLYSGSNKSFILFSNIDNDVAYDAGDSCGSPVLGDECLEALNIISANKISEIFIKHGNGNGQTTMTENGTLDIFFKRPNPEPTFCARVNAGNGVCSFGNDISYIKVKIMNEGNSGIYKIVTIYNNGQISVD